MNAVVASHRLVRCVPDRAPAVPAWSYETKWRRPRCVLPHVERAFSARITRLGLWELPEATDRDRRHLLAAPLRECAASVPPDLAQAVGSSIRYEDFYRAFPPGELAHRRTYERALARITSGGWAKYRTLMVVLWRACMLQAYNDTNTVPYYVQECDTRSDMRAGDGGSEGDFGCDADVAVSCYENKHLPVMWYVLTAPCLTVLGDAAWARTDAPSAEDAGWSLEVAEELEPEWQRDFGVYYGPALTLPVEYLLTHSFCLDRVPKLDVHRCKPHMKRQSIDVLIALLFRKCMGQRCLPKDVASACLRDSPSNPVMRLFLTEAFLRFFFAPESRHVTTSLDRLRYGSAEKLAMWAHLGVTRGYATKRPSDIGEFVKALATGGGSVIFLLVIRHVMNVALLDEPALMCGMRACCNWESVMENDTQSAACLLMRLQRAVADGHSDVERLLGGDCQQLSLERPLIAYTDAVKQRLNVVSLWGALQRSEWSHLSADRDHLKVCDDAVETMARVPSARRGASAPLAFDALLDAARAMKVNRACIDSAAAMNQADVPISLHGVTKLVKAMESDDDFWGMWAAAWVNVRHVKTTRLLKLSAETRARQRSALRLRFGIEEDGEVPSVFYKHFICMECNGHDRIKAVLLSGQSTAQLPHPEQKRLSEEQCTNGVLAFGRRAMAYDLEKGRYVCCRKRQCKADKAYHQRKRCMHYPLVEADLLGNMLCIAELRYFLCTKCAAVCCCVRTPIMRGEDVMCGQCATFADGGYKPLAFVQRCVHCKSGPCTDRLFNAVQNLGAIAPSADPGVGAGRSKPSKRARLSGDRGRDEAHPKPGRAFVASTKTSGRKLSTAGSKGAVDASGGRFVWMVHDDERPPRVALEWICDGCCKPWVHNASWVWPKSFMFFGMANGLRERESRLPEAERRPGGPLVERTLHCDKAYPGRMFALM